MKFCLPHFENFVNDKNPQIAYPKLNGWGIYLGFRPGITFSFAESVASLTINWFSISLAFQNLIVERARGYGESFRNF